MGAAVAYGIGAWIARPEHACALLRGIPMLIVAGVTWWRARIEIACARAAIDAVEKDRRDVDRFSSGGR